MAREAVERALSLEPDLPEAHVAAGYYHYWGHLDYDRALAEFAIARERQPSSAWVYVGIASVQRRQGKMRRAADKFSRALELDPRSTVTAVNLQRTYVLLRDAPSAHRVVARIRSLSPDTPFGYILQSFTHVRLEGDTEKARAALDYARSVGVWRTQEDSCSWPSSSRSAGVRGPRRRPSAAIHTRRPTHPDEKSRARPSTISRTVSVRKGSSRCDFRNRARWTATGTGSSACRRWRDRPSPVLLHRSNSLFQRHFLQTLDRVAAAESGVVSGVKPGCGSPLTTRCARCGVPR